MSLSKYVSETKYIDQNNEVVFNYLSDFENLSKYITAELLEKAAESMPKMKITDFESDSDSCRFNISGMGQSEIRIIGREPFKTIKIKGGGQIPIDITLWIQLLPASPYQTKMRLTLHAEMNMMIKMMAGNKLEKGIDQLADVIAQLPFR